MDVSAAVKGRRSIRAFTPDPISEADLAKLLDAARWAPSAGNQQKWRFVVVTDLGMKELVKQFAPGIFVMPAAFIVICAEKKPGASAWDEQCYLADCSIAAQNIMLAAYELGIGSCLALSYAKVAAQEILSIPENVEPYLVVTLGYAAEDPAPPPRLELNEIAFVDEYGKEWSS
ncbi:nitroreductase family protein [Chloroflexota bacterium]